jgi:hypothetical protein
MDRARALENVRREMKEDGASTLRRLGEQLEAALGAWKAEPHSEPLRRAAADRLWVMVVQREAMGLLRHDELYEVYAVPPALVARMAPSH